MTAPVHSGYVQTSDPTKPRSDAAVPFRDIIPSPSHPRIAGIANHTALGWCESRRQIEAPAWLINRLDAKNLEKPYKGFTSDGKVREGLYNYADDEGAPTEEVMARTADLFEILSDEEKNQVHCGEVTDDDFRLWSNPELYMNPGMQVAHQSEICHQRWSRLIPICRWSPTRRMLSRSTNRDSRDPQICKLSQRVRKDPWLLSHKRLPRTPCKRQESPQRTLLQLPTLRCSLDLYTVGLYILWTSSLPGSCLPWEENGNWANIHGRGARQN
jgi:hypothetical protein